MVDQDFKSLVIEKAKEIFIIYGYKKTTMEDIAKACHKSKGLIYHHYKSKEEVFRIIVNREIAEMLTTMKKELGEQKSAKDKLDCLFSFMSKWCSDATSLYHKMIIDVFEYIDFIKDILLKLHSDVLDIVKKILTDSEKNEFKVDKIELTALTILQMMMGFMYTPFKKLLNVDIEGEVNIDNYIDIIYNGLKKN